MDTEDIRNSFRPKKIRLLLIGESPPSGGKFFYVHSPMTSYTARAFEKAHKRDFSSQDQTEFLEYFKTCGCYLDDVCHFPIDGFDDEKRKQALAENVPALTARLKDFRPEAIAIVLKKVETHVRVAIVLAEIKPEVFVLPFPGHGHQGKYIDLLEKIVKEHAASAR